MKKKKLILLIFTIISIFLISYNILQEKVIAAPKFESLPNNIELGNYSVDITESTLYENYLLTKYTVKTIDKSNINQNPINIKAIINSNNNYQENYNTVILQESYTTSNQVEIILLDFLSIPSDSSIKLKYSLYDSISNESKTYNVYNNYESLINTDAKNGYYNISDSLTVDNIDIVIQNLFVRKSQSILCLSTQDENFNPKDYVIKLKSNNFEDIFFINNTGINGSYYVPMVYNDAIELKNIEIHLINIFSNNKTLIYSN